MTRKGDVAVLYTFAQSGGVDGNSPEGDLIQDKNGALFGTTEYGGGMNNEGTVFSLAPDGTETVFHSFVGGGDGAGPSGGVINDDQGNLYGVTAYGGPGTNCFGNGCGTVFSLSQDGTVTILYAFTGGQDGSNPIGTLIKDGVNGFFGATPEGGAYGYGTVFWVEK
jgi:uncharacterized repeat protein (TIGR03803 family)